MHTDKVQTYTLFGILAIASVLTFLIFRPFLIPIALALIFAVVLYPLYGQVVNRMPSWRGLAAFITIMVLVVGLFIPFTLLGLRVLAEAQDAATSLTRGSGFEQVRTVIIAAGGSLEAIVPGAASAAEETVANLSGYFRQALTWFLSHLGGAVSGIIEFSIDLVIFIASLYVFLRNGPQIRKRFIALSPFPDPENERILRRLALTVHSVVRGSLAVALVQGVVAGIGYYLFGLPNPLLWGTITGFAALVPGIGTALVLAPAIVYLGFTSGLSPALGLLIWGVIAVGLVDNFLGPVLMSRGVHLPALMILLSVLGGVAFFGPAGIFLGPLTVSTFIAFFELYASRSAAVSPDS